MRAALVLLPALLRAALLVPVLSAAHTHTAHGDGLLQEAHVRVYVADLPLKYNLHILAKEGCENDRFLKQLLGNPLGPLYSASIDEALYRGPGTAALTPGGSAAASKMEDWPCRDTPYYGMGLYMHLQMLSSPLRVLTAEEADIVYVPFYGSHLWPEFGGIGGEGACKPQWTDATVDALVAGFWADAPALLPLLGAKPHWVQLSEIEGMLHRGCGEGWGLPLMCHPLAAHVIFATADVLTEGHPEHGRQRYSSRQPSNNNSIAVPYMGHIHRIGMQHRAEPLAGEDLAAGRRYLATMAFGSMRSKGAARLRNSLTDECNANGGDCWYIRYKNVSNLKIIQSYRQSYFCVQPYGDSPTRLALFDCMASGLAVPCVFDEFLFDMLPFADVLDYRSMLVYVPPDLAMAPNGGLLDQLRAVGADAHAAMLASLQQVSQVFQYAVQPNHLLVRLDSLAVVHPLDDAFTMSVKAVLRYACRRGYHRCHRSFAGHGHALGVG